MFGLLHHPGGGGGGNGVGGRYSIAPLHLYAIHSNSVPLKMPEPPRAADEQLPAVTSPVDKFVSGAPLPVSSAAERWTFINTIKLVTSFAFLIPLAATSPATDAWYYLHAAAWILITCGCLAHHFWPASRALHSFDHYCIIIGIGIVMGVKLNTFHSFPVWLYAVAAACTYRIELYRMLVVAAGFMALIVWFGPSQADGGRLLYGVAIASVATFIAQRLQVLRMSDSGEPYNEFGKNPKKGGAQAGGRPMETDKLVAVQKKTQEVADQVRQNIDAVIERGDKISDLEDKSAELEAQSVTFAKKSHEVKRAMCWQSYRMLLLLLLIVVILIIVIYFSVKSMT